MKWNPKKRGVLFGVIALIFIATTAYKNDYFEIAKKSEREVCCLGGCWPEKISI